MAQSPKDSQHRIFETLEAIQAAIETGSIVYRHIAFGLYSARLRQPL